MTVADNLRKICAAARPAIEAALDAAEELSEIREAASEQGLDWSQVKALLKAQIQDERDGGERVKKLVAKAENAAAYAVMLEKPTYVEGPNVVEKKKTLPQSIAASTTSPPTRGDEAVPGVTSPGTASPNSRSPKPLPSVAEPSKTGDSGDDRSVGLRDAPISEAAPALGVVGGDRTDAASSQSAADPTQVTSLASGGGNLAGSNAGHSLSETDADDPSQDSIVEPAALGVSIPSDEIEPVSDPGLSAGSPISWIDPDIDPDPSDIRNQPFYREGQEWPR